MLITMTDTSRHNGRCRFRYGPTVDQTNHDWHITSQRWLHVPLWTNNFLSSDQAPCEGRTFASGNSAVTLSLQSIKTVFENFARYFLAGFPFRNVKLVSCGFLELQDVTSSSRWICHVIQYTAFRLSGPSP